MAKVKDTIHKARILLDDTGESVYSNYEMLNFFNDACEFLAMELITQRDDSMIKEEEFSNGQDLPDLFVEFVGQNPIRLIGNEVRTNTGEPVSVRYWSKFDVVKSLDEKIPYRPMYDTPIAKLTALYAMAKSNAGIPSNAEAVNYIKENIALIRQQKQKMSQVPATT